MPLAVISEALARSDGWLRAIGYMALGSWIGTAALWNVVAVSFATR